jgi:hypothetical protein
VLGIAGHLLVACPTQPQQVHLQPGQNSDLLGHCWPPLDLRLATFSMVLVPHFARRWPHVPSMTSHATGFSL